MITTTPTLPATLGNLLLTLPLSAALPRALPVTHMSIARWFDDIVRQGGLAPRMCAVFKEPLVYFFYGGAFYRHTNHPTQNATELPVVFVLSPRVLPRMTRYFPFDTGAVESGKVGKGWGSRLGAWKVNFGVPGTDRDAAAKIVHHVFGTNERYLAGDVETGCRGKPDPLPLLHDYASADLSAEKVDHRQTRIECQTDQAIGLDAELEWVGFPQSFMDTFMHLCKHLGGRVPEYFAYSYSRNFNPYALGQMLEEKAREAVIDRYLRLPA